MTLCGEEQDVMCVSKNPAARGSGAIRLRLNYENGSSLQRQGFIEINYIAFASLNRGWRG